MSKIITSEELELVLSKLKIDYKIMAPVAEFRGGRFSDTDNLSYKEVNNAKDIVWKKKSFFSAKEVVSPITQELFNFKGKELDVSVPASKPQIVFLRACDINALHRQDYVYLKSGDNADFYYKHLRSRLKLILIECRESFENCFCVSMGTNITDDYAASVRFTDQGAEIEIKDPDLETYFEGFGENCRFSPQFIQSNPSVIRTPDQVCNDPQKIRSIVTDHDMWKQYESRCIGCGRCTTSCPTCSCYSVFDLSYDENQNFGERRRQHSSCMIDKFTDMAGGHGFRETHDKRLRYRALHKVNDFKQRQGEEHMCVGCGRCDDRCPQYISFSNVINKMTDSVEETVSKEGGV